MAVRWQTSYHTCDMWDYLICTLVLLTLTTHTSHTLRCVFFSPYGVQGGQQQPWVIVGGGRVGEALSNMSGGRDVVLRRGAAAIDGPPGPIVVCTRNDSLAGVVAATPAARRKDLVFIQNGMLQPWLDAQGLGGNTQVLVYFAVAAQGDAPTDGKTDANPEGLTAACGPHAEAVASRLHAAGLSCKVLGPEAFKGPMLEKLIWISAFMLVGARHGGCTVGEVEAKHPQEVGRGPGRAAAPGVGPFGQCLAIQCSFSLALQE